MTRNHILSSVRSLCLLAIAGMFFAVHTLCAQEMFPVNGVQDKRPHVYAFTNARIVVSPSQTLNNATLVVRKDVIEAIGVSVPIPADAIVVNASGKTIYASFIDLDSEYGMPTTPPEPFIPGPTQTESKQKGAYYWNQAIRADKQAYTVFQLPPPPPTLPNLPPPVSQSADYRNAGFGIVQTFPHDGIARGVACVVSLADAKENIVLLKDRSSAQYSFSKGSSRQDYPSSLMGSIALLRQLYYDGQWYNQFLQKKEYNITLDAFLEAQKLPQIFDAGDDQNILRAHRIADEFGVRYVLRGSGYEYQSLRAIADTKAALILPVNFPQTFDVEDPFDAQLVSLAEMKHWELASSNPAMVEKAGISFALTSAGIARKAEFLENIRTAIRMGLSKERALSALTIVPAGMLRMTDRVGTLEKGKLANFFIASGDIFEKETIIHQHWIQGIKHDGTAPDLLDIRGTYSLVLSGAETMNYTLTLSGAIDKPKAEFQKAGDSTKFVGAVERVGSSVNIRFALDAKSKQDITLNGSIENVSSLLANTTKTMAWSGKGRTPTAGWATWSATRVQVFEPKPVPADTANLSMMPGSVLFPFHDFGFKELPKQETVLFKNATLWTAEADSILPNTDILLQNGRIMRIGKNLSEPLARIIDATGKHITPGIIDEHSHIAATGGINEATQSVTSEVRIGDIINAKDVNIYRQLAGGVTTSHILHGSANAIGGQTMLIKLRWGATPEQMKFENADGFIKFALGENVKQANWGDFNTTRYPQTRMGVEQVILDGFNRAREYEEEWKKFNALTKTQQAQTPTPRKNLELDALVEILNKKRFITCHSYIQSEITMLIRLAEQFGFTVNTFTHILEGYKVADKLKAHGANASSFSDWWAYKAEVIDAIPYNGAILNYVGVNTSFNSDDAEMARRLNQEAAKAVKYGNVPQHDALKFVTLNPAKMLHIDNRTGSLKVGKDADIVVWNTNPLSIYAKAEKTFIDGTCYFDIERDLQLRLSAQTERTRLIQKLLDAKRTGKPVQKPVRRFFVDEHYHCDSVE